MPIIKKPFSKTFLIVAVQIELTRVGLTASRR